MQPLIDCESWRDISGYEGLYQVSDQGRVRSLGLTKKVKSKWGSYMEVSYKPKILKQGYSHKRGYPKVYLYKGGLRTYKYIHRIVAIAFIENPQNLSEVNHKNGNKKDNSVDNLEWCSPSENMRHWYHELGGHRHRMPN